MRLISSGFAKLLLILLLPLQAWSQLQFGIFENTTLTSPDSERIKSATAAMIRKEKLLDPNLYQLKDLYRYCNAQPFSEQTIWASCSATLISKNVVLTAGHCVYGVSDCENLSFTFDFKDSADIDAIRKNPSQIFSCKKILYSSKPVPQQQLRDWALIQLDRDVTNREPIALSARIPGDEVITTFGHPFGISQKFTRGFISKEDSVFNESEKSSPFYKGSLITPAGISGGGVYDSQLNLIGLLVRGGAAYESDDGKCIRPVECTSENCPWAEIQKLEFKKIRSLIKKAN